MTKNELKETIRDIVLEILHENTEVNEYHFTKQNIEMVRSDILQFIKDEMKKLGYVDSLSAYHFIQDVLDSGQVHSKVKGLR